MSTILFNNKVIALRGKLTTGAITLPVNPMVDCATKYGLFFPISSTGYQFIRWLQKECPAIDFDNEVTFSSDLIHVANDGSVHVVIVDSSKNRIQMFPYSSEVVSYISMSREHSEAYTYLFKKRKLNMSQAIELVATGTKSGFYNPIIISVGDWVKHAEENDLTAVFFRTKLSNH